MSQMTATALRPSRPMTALVSDLVRRLEAVPLALPQLMARLGVGAVFWKSGLTKVASWQTTVALFEDEYRLPLLPPEVAALLGTAMELVCPVLLVLGLLTRLGALGLLGMTAVIQLLVYPENWVEHLTWASLLVLLAIRGAGPISLDHFLGARLRGSR